MANIYVEGKGPKGVQIKESLLPAAVTGYTRGLAVNYGADSNHATLATVAATAALGILEEDALSVKNPCSVIEFGQVVAQIGATVTAQQTLTTDANGRLVPATAGQPVVAIALEAQTYVSPGSFAVVFWFGLLGPLAVAGNAGVTHYVANGAIPVASGIAGLGSAGALSMTLATPTAAQDGTTITIVAETAHGHKVVTAANKINGADDTVTFAAVGDTVTVVAVGQIWTVQSISGATLSEV